MQYNHSFYSYPVWNTAPTNIQPNANYYQTGYQPCLGPQYPSPGPEITGEGDVTSVMYPDGSVQLYFIPRTIASNPYDCRTHVWLIRSVSNAAPLHQPAPCYQNSYGVPYATPPTEPKPLQSYLLKFHNDGSTSTSDLHYYFPSLRCCEWVPKLAAAVQAEIPCQHINAYHYQVICHKACESAMSIDKGITKPNIDQVDSNKDYYNIFNRAKNGGHRSLYINENKQYGRPKIDILKTCECSRKSSGSKTNNKMVSIKKEKNVAKEKHKTKNIECQCYSTTDDESTISTDDTKIKKRKEKKNKEKKYSKDKVEMLDKKVVTYTDQSNSYSLDKNVGPTSNCNMCESYILGKSRKSTPSSSIKKVESSNLLTPSPSDSLQDLCDCNWKSEL